jgi:hypothetical protein
VRRFLLLNENRGVGLTPTGLVLVEEISRMNKGVVAVDIEGRGEIGGKRRNRKEKGNSRGKYRRKRKRRNTRKKEK